MDLVKEGQKIALYFQKDNNLVEMVCTIEKVSDDRLTLGLPQYFMRYIDSLQEECQLTAKIFTKIGTIDFNTIVIASPFEDVFEIEMDYNAIKLTENSEIPLISAVETLEIIFGENSSVKVKTFEVSTEHVKFTYDKELTIGSVYEFNIYLPKDYGIINFRGTITEIDPIYDNEYTVKFSTITENDRQSLLYYIYMYSTDV